ncbi:MAG: uroporphyrinogen decarboxylase [Actinomycetota bacterium]
MSGPHHDAPLLRALRQEPGSRVPVWFMRQAGRSLPEYFPVRGEGTILDAISVPERAAEITLQPVRRYGVDAAILFSDIVTPVWASGFGIDITPGVGPECEHPFASAADLDRLRPLDAEADLGFQTETVRALVAELDVPLIGFAGAPFTLAAYLVEGRPSRDHAKVKSLMVGDEALWHQLCERLADQAIVTLTAQVEAGASAIQLFDSWAGALHPEHYRRYVAGHSRRILAAMADLGVPTLHFGINTGELLDEFAAAGAHGVGVDWRTSLRDARARTGGRVALQGNLDPALCLAPWPAVEAEVRRVLADNDGHPGHIFNLGHGVLPQTNPEILEQVVALVHAEGRADGASAGASATTTSTAGAGTTDGD